MRKSFVVATSIAAVLAVAGTSGAVAGSMVGSKAIRDNSVRSIDIKDGAVRPVDLFDGLLDRINKPGPEGPVGADGASAFEVAVANGFEGTEEEWLASLVGEQGPKGDQGDPASDTLGGLAGQAASDPQARTQIAYLGGTVLHTQNRGVTSVTSIDLEPGTYLVSAYGHFDRLNDNEAGYVAPDTETYGALILWTGDEVFSSFDEAAGTYFTGAISPRGFIEATGSGSQVLEVTEATTLHVGAFGYNEDRSSFGSIDAASGGQFTVYANASAVKVG